MILGVFSNLCDSMISGSVPQYYYRFTETLLGTESILIPLRTQGFIVNNKLLCMIHHLLFEETKLRKF